MIELTISEFWLGVVFIFLCGFMIGLRLLD